MRDIEFRGKRVDGGKWVYGYYKYMNKAQIADDCFYWHDVDAKTVGEYTGLRDSKRTEEFPIGQKIYEGDFLKFTLFDGVENVIRIVKFNKGAFSPATMSYLECEVIGNIHDNPELLTK